MIEGSLAASIDLPAPGEPIIKIILTLPPQMKDHTRIAGVKSLEKLDNSVSTKTKAYSYLRFSSPEQAAGDSLRRQVSLAENYARVHGMELDTSLKLSDLGVSAYRGAHTRLGAFGAFLRAIDEGLVPVGSYLLVESLDRVSRQGAWDAMPIIQQIVNAGVNLVTVKDEKLFSRAGFMSNPFLIFEALFVFVRSHEESETKARRLKAVWGAKRQKAQNGATVLTRRAPAWLEFNEHSGRFEIIEERASTVRRIFSDFVAGKGTERIAQSLNDDNIPTFGRAAYWGRSYVIKILENPAVIGTLIPHTTEWDSDGRKSREAQTAIANYFPPVISQSDYEDVTAARSKSQQNPKPRATGIQNLFAGLARCSTCGGTMTRTTKGSGPKAGKPYLVCVAAKMRSGCQQPSVRQEVVEAAALNNIDLLQSLVPSLNRELEIQIEEKSQELLRALTELGNLTEAVANAGSTTLAVAIQQTEARVNETRGEMDRLIQRSVASDPKAQQRRMSQLKAKTSTAPLEVATINSLLRQVFSSVVIDADQCCLRFNWIQGGEVPVPYSKRRDGSMGEHVALVCTDRNGLGRAVIVRPATGDKKIKAERY